MKTQVLIEKDDVDVLQTLEIDAFTDSYNFTFTNGFNIAVAFTAYDDNQEPILDKSYGEVVFNHFEWGHNASDETTFVRRKRIATHPCSQEELGLIEDRSESTFFPIVPNSRLGVKKYQKKFICANPEDLYLYGTYDTESAS